MANSIEWSTADYLPSVVDPGDVPSGYEGLSQGEVGVWLGSDGANILYGSKRRMIAWGVAFLNAVADAVPVGDPLDGNLIGTLNADMFGTLSEPDEHVDWSEPDIHTTSAWEGILGAETIEEYAETSPHMIVFVVDPEDAEDLGYDWQDDAIGAMR
jgi:hypothetical protein